MFRGSIVALVTPMRADGSVDFDGLGPLVDFHCEAGTDAIVVVGTTGESATLEFDEHIEVITRVTEAAAGRLPVIGGTGANSTAEAIALTRAAAEAGVDGCLLVTPYYNKPTQEGLYRHFKALAEAVDIPQILYNVPGRTAVDMQVETVQRLAGIGNIVALKEASGDLQRSRELVDLCGSQIALFSGDDDLACEQMLMGFSGVISVTANVAPRLMHDMAAAALAGDADKAAELDDQLAGLHRDLFLESNPIPVKWAVAKMGLIPTGIRLPLTPLSDQFHRSLNDSMVRAGIDS
ncbi:MAG: 4-hydroxy-tetrahydrodipicolinate synthase [Immundisolibacteraceae bacterium]|nr:4-hydroxy-tetrahydrodipicolinate synthase [Immundisolibacteraceae bacterium]